MNCRYIPAMSKQVFITGCGSFLPGEAVCNAAMEDHIGRIHGRPSLLGRRALRWNGIETRHYALDNTGHAFQTNAGMSAKAHWTSRSLQQSERRTSMFRRPPHPAVAGRSPERQYFGLCKRG